MDIVYAIFNFPGTTEEDLPLTAGDRVQVLSRDDEFGDGWWEGRSLETGRTGLFPKIYTAEQMPSPSLVGTSAASLQTGSVSEFQQSYTDDDKSDAPESDVAGVQGTDYATEHTASDKAPEHEAIQGDEDDNFVYPALGPAVLSAPGSASSLHNTPEPLAPRLHLSVEQWTPSQVTQHFQNLHFDLASKFEEHEVSGRVLLAMQHADLREIDIVAFGKRFEVMREIDVLRQVGPQQHQQQHGGSRGDVRDTATPTPGTMNGYYSNEASPSYATDATSQGVQSLRINTAAAKEYNNNIKSPTMRNTPALQIAGGADFPSPHNNGVMPPPSQVQTKGTSPETSPTRSRIKALSTSSIAPLPTPASALESRHSRAWSQDTAAAAGLVAPPGQLSGTDARRSEILGAVPELNGSIISTDSSSERKSQSPTTYTGSPASAEPTSHGSPRTNGGAALQQKRSFLGRRQPKWRPNAVSENLEQLPVSEAVKQADFSGWLRKRSERTYQWNLRYFVLKGTRLAYYLTDEDTQERGIIDINAYKVQPVDDVLFYGPAKLTFKVVPPAPGASRSLNFTPPRTVYFHAESVALMREWMTAMTKATIGRDWSTPVISSCTTKTISLKAAREQRQQKTAAAATRANGLEAALDVDEEEGEAGQESLQRRASGASLSSLRKAVMGAAH